MVRPHRRRPKDAIVDLYDERFFRLWTFYLAGAGAAFRNGGLCNYQIQLAKSRTAIPVTRDYIGETERALARIAATGADLRREATRGESGMRGWMIALRRWRSPRPAAAQAAERTKPRRRSASSRRTGHRLAETVEPTAAELAPIVAKLAGARVIGLGEVTHGTHEDVAFKALLLRELVEGGRGRHAGDRGEPRRRRRLRSLRARGRSATRRRW